MQSIANKPVCGKKPRRQPGKLVDFQRTEDPDARQKYLEQLVTLKVAQAIRLMAIETPVSSAKECGLPLSGGPVSVLVHYGSWRYSWGGRRSGSGWRSRPLDGLGSWRAIPQ